MTKKIVINTCYGGFGLSDIAVKRYFEIKGEPIFVYTQADYGTRLRGALYKKAKFRTHKDGISHFVTKDLGESAESEDLNDNYWSCCDLKRDDPILVRVVDDLGEKANSGCAKLKIVEIPDDVEWEIDEYDGIEWVSEKHRRWD